MSTNLDISALRKLPDKLQLGGSSKLRFEFYNVIDQLEETSRKINQMASFIGDVFTECDEYGMEPSIPCGHSGKQIVDGWRKKYEEYFCKGA